MKRCDLLVDVGRRRFLSGAGMAAAGAAVTAVIPVGEGKAAVPTARVVYPSAKLGNIKDLKPNEPMDVAYPDADAPGVLIKLGKRVPGGVGADGDVVGFTTICPHKGYPLTTTQPPARSTARATIRVFDCEAGGQETWGHAPRISRNTR